MFASGFLGYLAQAGDIDEMRLRQATTHGIVLASFNVEAFGTERVARLGTEATQERVEKLIGFTQVSVAGGGVARLSASGTSAGLS